MFEASDATRRSRLHRTFVWAMRALILAFITFVGTIFLSMLVSDLHAEPVMLSALSLGVIAFLVASPSYLLLWKRMQSTSDEPLNEVQRTRWSIFDPSLAALLTDTLRSAIRPQRRTRASESQVDDSNKSNAIGQRKQLLKRKRRVVYGVLYSMSAASVFWWLSAGLSGGEPTLIQWVVAAGASSLPFLFWWYESSD